MLAAMIVSDEVFNEFWIFDESGWEELFFREGRKPKIIRIKGKNWEQSAGRESLIVVQCWSSSCQLPNQKPLPFQKLHSARQTLNLSFRTGGKKRKSLKFELWTEEGVCKGVERRSWICEGKGERGGVRRDMRVKFVILSRHDFFEDRKVK